MQQHNKTSRKKSVENEIKRRAKKKEHLKKIIGLIDTLKLKLPINLKRDIKRVDEKCRHLYDPFRPEQDWQLSRKLLKHYLKHHLTSESESTQMYLPYPEAMPQIIHFREGEVMYSTGYRSARVAQYGLWVEDITTANRKAVDRKNQEHIENFQHLKALQQQYGDLTIGELLDLEEAAKKDSKARTAGAE